MLANCLAHDQSGNVQTRQSHNIGNLYGQSQSNARWATLQTFQVTQVKTFIILIPHIYDEIKTKPMNIAKKKVLFVKTLKFERPSVNVFKNGIFVLTDDGTKMSQTFCIWKVLPAKKGATFTFLPYLQRLAWKMFPKTKNTLNLICYTISDEVKKNV